MSKLNNDLTKIIFGENIETEPNLCEVCEEETGCDYLNDGISTVCCSCDDDMERGHECASCYSGLVSDAYDCYKDQQLQGMK